MTIVPATIPPPATAAKQWPRFAWDLIDYVFPGSRGDRIYRSPEAWPPTIAGQLRAASFWQHLSEWAILPAGEAELTMLAPEPYIAGKRHDTGEVCLGSIWTADPDGIDPEVINADLGAIVLHHERHHRIPGPVRVFSVHLRKDAPPKAMKRSLDEASIAWHYAKDAYHWLQSRNLHP